MITTAFEAKRNLVAMIRNLPEFDSRYVLYGHHGTNPPDSDEWVWVGEIEWDREAAVAFGKTLTSREEAYRIVVTLEAHVDADTQEEANARVEDKMYALEGAIRVGPGNPNPLNVPGLVTLSLEPQFLGEGQGSTGRDAILVVTVLIVARK